VGYIAENTLISLESKGYAQNKIPVDKLLDHLIKKVRDTLSMFRAAWLNCGKGWNIRNERPEEYRTY
jgi:hypothetical protein